MTLPASTQRITSTVHETETSYASGKAPATVTQFRTRVESVVSSIPTTVISTKRIISTQHVTETSYASGKQPATVTVVSTQVERVRVPKYVTTTMSPSTLRITTTQHIVSTERIIETSYASGKAPATVTKILTHVKSVTSRVPTTVISTKRITETERITSYASGKPPATVTSVSTHFEVSTKEITRTKAETVASEVISRSTGEQSTDLSMRRICLRMK